MQRFAWGMLLGLILAGSGWANAPDRSLRPVPGPPGTAQPAAGDAPQVRGAAEVPLQVQAAALVAGMAAGPLSSPRPRERPVVRISGASEPPQPVRQADPVPSSAPVVLALLAAQTGTPEDLDLPLIFARGRTSLGPFPLGPAPRMGLRDQGTGSHHLG